MLRSTGLGVLCFWRAGRYAGVCAYSQDQREQEAIKDVGVLAAHTKIFSAAVHWGYREYGVATVPNSVAVVAIAIQRNREVFLRLGY